MKEIELARKYMDIFFETKDFDSLDLILDENLDFDGPLFKCKSAKEYIESLKASPPVNVSYEMVEEFRNPNSICYIYKFTKNCRSTLIVQTFHFNVGRISKIRLIFNPEEIS
ncbi:hypothetical protein ACJJIW_11605 [Microbulbifer sp. JMSA004]|uniref:hypothetical protein n=1 Tax=Microbulbifer sp. JMSA004 TaxID=3243370 RepID=UPI00403A39D4